MAVIIPPRDRARRARLVGRIDDLADRIEKAGWNAKAAGAGGFRLFAAAGHARHLARLIEHCDRPFDTMDIPPERWGMTPSPIRAGEGMGASVAADVAALGGGAGVAW